MIILLSIKKRRHAIIILFVDDYVDQRQCHMTRPPERCIRIVQLPNWPSCNFVGSSYNRLAHLHLYYVSQARHQQKQQRYILVKHRIAIESQPQTPAADI